MKTIAVISYNIVDFQKWLKENITPVSIFRPVNPGGSIKYIFNNIEYLYISNIYKATEISLNDKMKINTNTIEYVRFTPLAAERLPNFGEILRLIQLLISQKKFYFGR